MFSALGRVAEIAANGGEPSMGAMFGIASVPYFLFILVNLIPNIAIVVRRFHDKNYTGWLYLGVIVLSIIPLLGFLVVIAFIVFMCLRGTVGPNKYGPDPLDGDGSSDVFV